MKGASVMGSAVSRSGLPGRVWRAHFQSKARQVHESWPGFAGLQLFLAPGGIQACEAGGAAVWDRSQPTCWPFGLPPQKSSVPSGEPIPNSTGRNQALLGVWVVSGVTNPRGKINNSEPCRGLRPPCWLCPARRIASVMRSVW